MELVLRKEVEEFIHACDRLARFAQQQNGLTEEERELAVVNFVRALESDIVPSHPFKDLGLAHPQLAQGQSPLANPSANGPLID